MLSSRTSDILRLRRAVGDWWSIALALGVALLALVLGWWPAVAVAAGLAVMAVRVAAEYLVPRAQQLEIRDGLAVQQAQLRASLEASIARSRTLPEPARERISAIRQTILDLIGRGGDVRVDQHALFTVVRTATDYLPTALDAYLQLPSDYAATRRLANGQTPLQVLTGQLDVLAAEMLEISDAVTRNDLDRLLAHGKFLSERFAHSELSFDEQEVPDA